MARSRNSMELRGQLSEFVFYTLNGKSVVRRKGIVPKSRYRKSDRFQRMRDNGKEFGGSAVIGRDLRHALSPWSKQLADPYVSARLSTVMYRVIQSGEGVPGKRVFDAERGLAALSGFEFNRDAAFASLFKGRVTMRVSAAKREMRVRFEVKDRRSLCVPKGAVRVQFIVLRSALGSYHYDGDAEGYVADAVLSDKTERHDAALSKVYDVKAFSSAGKSAVIELKLPVEERQGLVPVLCVGVVFWDKEGRRVGGGMRVE